MSEKSSYQIVLEEQIVRELRYYKNMEINSPELCERAADRIESQIAHIAELEQQVTMTVANSICQACLERAASLTCKGTGVVRPISAPESGVTDPAKLPPDIKHKLRLMITAFAAGDHSEAHHWLYAILCPGFNCYDPHAAIEGRECKCGPHDINAGSQLPSVEQLEDMLDAVSKDKAAATPTMAMLPNDYHPGPRCSCRECLRGFPENSKGAATPTATILCPNCDKDEVGTFTADNWFLYGVENQYRLVAKNVLFFRCMACDLEFIGEDGERKRLQAVNEHLARMAAAKERRSRELGNTSEN